MVSKCESCGADYAPKRATAKYCSPKCRKRAADQREADRSAERAAAATAAPATSRPAIAPSTDFVERVAAELEAAKRLDTVAGQQALLLARRMQDPRESFGSAAAALSRELREVMAEAMAGVAQADDPIDELQRRRERKHQSA